MNEFWVFRVYNKGVFLSTDLITFLNRRTAALKDSRSLPYVRIYVPDTGYQDQIRGMCLMLGYDDKLLTFVDWKHGHELKDRDVLIVLGHNDRIVCDVNPILLPQT